MYRGEVNIKRLMHRLKNPTAISAGLAALNAASKGCCGFLAIKPNLKKDE